MTQGVHSKVGFPRRLVVLSLILCAVPSLLILAGLDLGSPWYPVPGDSFSPAVRGHLIFSALEGAAFWVALFAVFLSFVHYGIAKDTTSPVLGVALLCGGFLDAFTVIQVSEVGHFSDVPTLWGFNRFYYAFVLLAGMGYRWVYRKRRFNFPQVLFLGFVLVSLGLVSSVGIGSLGEGSPLFRLGLQRSYAFASLFIYAIVLPFAANRYYQKHPGYFSHALLISIVPLLFAQVHMVLGSSVILDSHFLVAHVLKVVSYVTLFLGLVLDYIRTYRLAEEVRGKLVEREERLTQIVAHIKEGIWMAAPDLKTLLFVSPGCQRIWGKNQEELLSDSEQLFGAVHEEDKERIEKAMQSMTKGTYREEYRIVQPNGKQVWVRDRAVPIKDEQGNVTSVIGFTEDVSARKHAEKLIAEQQQRMNHSSKLATLGEMAGGISHEINNPLAIIRGRANRLKKLAQQGTVEPEAILKSVESIDTTVVRITRIIKGLRSFAQMDSGDPFAKVKVKSIVNDALEFGRAKFEQGNVELRIPEISDQMVLECRSSQVTHILLALLNNAYTAVYERRERWVELRVHEAESAVVFEVIDSGKGILPEVREKIFDPFFTTNDIGKGTGLGLSISKGIAESHRGNLEYDAASRNTLFVLRLPKQQRKALRQLKAA